MRHPTRPPIRSVGPYAWGLAVAVWSALLTGPRPTTTGTLLLLAGWAVLGIVLQAIARGMADDHPAPWLLITCAAIAVAILGASLRA